MKRLRGDFRLRPACELSHVAANLIRASFTLFNQVTHCQPDGLFRACLSHVGPVKEEIGGTKRAH